METDTIRTIRTSYGMFTIDGVRDKKIAAALARGDYPNEGLITIASTFVDKKSIVVDIGAHIGTFAVPIAAMVEKVIAFEPSLEAVTLLSRNAEENNVTLQIINKALGNFMGSGTLVVRNASNAGANTIVAGGDIPVVTLDSEVMHADFIKIDVEGMELEVLHGGLKLLEHSRPVVWFEVNLSQLRAHGTSPRALEKFFIRLGYNLYVPLERTHGTLARVHSATLLTTCIAPRAWFFFGESAPFDLIAVPKERALPLPYASFITALVHAFKNNLRVKMHRLACWCNRL